MDNHQLISALMAQIPPLLEDGLESATWNVWTQFCGAKSPSAELSAQMASLKVSFNVQSRHRLIAATLLEKIQSLLRRVIREDERVTNESLTNATNAKSDKSVYVLFVDMIDDLPIWRDAAMSHFREQH